MIADVPPPDARRRASTGLRVAFLGGYFTAALDDDVAAMLERARGRVRAGEIDIAWSQADNREMSPIFTAEPGAFVLEHDPEPRRTPALRRRPPWPTSRPPRSLPAIDYVRARRELAEARRRCAAAASGYDILLCAPRRRARRSRSTGRTRRRA